MVLKLSMLDHCYLIIMSIVLYLIPRNTNEKYPHLLLYQHPTNINRGMQEKPLHEGKTG